jgi:translation initiation factor 3 subunit M
MLPSTSPNANDALLEAIVDGLRLSSVFNFEPILGLPNIALIKAHPLFKLIRIFVLGQGLAQYHEALPEFEPELAKNSASPSI